MKMSVSFTYETTYRLMKRFVDDMIYFQRIGRKNSSAQISFQDSAKEKMTYDTDIISWSWSFRHFIFDWLLKIFFFFPEWRLIVIDAFQCLSIDEKISFRCRVFEAPD